VETIEIWDRQPNGLLNFDLSDLTQLLRDIVQECMWRCSGIECVGKSAERLHAFSDSGVAFPGEELLDLVTGIRQVVDGELIGRPAGHSEPSLIFRAIDSSLWEVSSSLPAVIQRVTARFQDVRPARGAG
jgi:hypothetical protein